MARISFHKDDERQFRDFSDEVHLSRSRVLRGAFLLAGFVFLGLGLVGVFLPILPTTPFLLLTAACFARGSRRFYNWLLNNRMFGGFIRDWRRHRSLTRRTKTVALAVLWGMFALTTLFLIEVPWLKAAILVIPVGITTFLMRIPTRELIEESAG